MITASEKRLHARMFGQAVLRMRKEMRLTTEELADVSLHLLGRIEVGAASGNEWGLREICALADVSGVRPDGLMEKWEQFIEEAGGAWWQARKVKD
jgi:hypothetical protein